ncbi:MULTISPECIES: IS481 family transposase [unclassified Streptomyces]|uniref:IS481 family transposase n=1 Tax=unclassified Streptomyces TaxID=2593676 RepID=UPI00225198FF|nr:IS481 family transposase [Streptomyces sp. NBC_01789]MCX4445970.1 IS481 family transposase [Streptomyces sp. NBC_01789]MCX4447009.1 IS481 family transposase [Streptomyces sp. NBC_01789]MCX4447736.1 IS481 family transposase [Streptomyces sp. NBC_01789]
MSHRNARLTVHGRRILVERVQSGRPVAHVAAEMGISRPTAHKWVRRWRAEGEAGLHDRPSRPHTTPHRTPATTEARACRLRTDRKLGPARIGAILGLPASTVHRILVRQGINRLSFLDRPTGRIIRRYERDRPGELVHVDIKKLGNIPDGGGHRVMDRRQAMDNKIATTDARKSSKPVIGYSFIHSAVDDHSRLAYSEVLTDERQHTAVAFWQRANAFFAAHGITVERVLTDNGSCYKSKLFTHALAAAGITHKRTRPYRPQTNGKVERFNRTLADEWAYQRPYRSNDERIRALADFLHTYNHHRSHTALNGKPPISRINNAAGQYT